MSKKEKEKQTIGNIKMLEELSNSGLVPSLFREVKRAKQQTINIINSFREQILSLQKQEEERVKQEALKTQAKMKQEASVQNESKQSFADLFLNKKDKEKQAEEVSTPKVVVEEKKPIMEQKEVQPQSAPVQKPFVQNSQNQNSPNRPQYSGRPANYSGPRPQNASPRPFNNYSNVRNEQNNNNYQNNNNSQRQPYGQRPFNNFNNRPYQPNNFNNRPYQPNNSGSNNFGSNGSFARKPYTPNANTSQNKSLSGIIPHKTGPLASATSVFVTKERDFTNKKKSTGYKSSYDDKRINKKSLIRRGLVEEQSIEERMVTRKLKLKKQKVEQAIVISAPVTNAVITTPNLTVKILSEKIGKPATDIIKQLMVLGVMTTINTPIDFETAELVSTELGVTLELKLEKTFEEKLKERIAQNDDQNQEKRAPIVTIVGHVDHGKTSLLDYIRKTSVTKSEAGGITQKIGAYSINWKGENITFVDTPGHEAFINMRKRGTEITDIAILIIAGDDGIKPQTVEAIKEIKAAKVPMIVAITKIDKPNIDLERIKNQLTEHDVLAEEWGGDTIVVPVSSVTGKGIDKLLETIILVAEIQELRANTKRKAVGTIMEASLDKNRGPIANVIVQNGTLRVGDSIVSGFALGKVRALIDDKGRFVAKAATSMPVSVLGFDSVPNAGDAFQVVDEKFSKNVIEERRIKMAQKKIENGAARSLDEFLATPKQEDKKPLNIIIKADSQGSAEALKQSISEIKNDEVAVEIVLCGVGNISENDIRLASVSKAMIVSFNTKVLSKITNFAKQNKVEIREYDIIYKAIEEIESIIKAMMAPKFEEKIVGHAQVRALFKISSVGTIAGCYVTDGKIVRNGLVKVLRDGKEIFEGKIATLKREKNDAREVASNYECGIRVEDFNLVLEGDILECSVREQITI